MHELSIALSIVDVAREEAERLGSGRVTAVFLKLGALSGVEREALLSSYDLACAGSPLEGSRLEIEDVPVVVYCPRCEAPRTLDSLQWFACAECGTPTGDIRQGKELQVVALEVDG
jgi:hydrogenase nickel incorporation protein HypA/HybF